MDKITTIYLNDFIRVINIFFFIRITLIKSFTKRIELHLIHDIHSFIRFANVKGIVITTNPRTKARTTQTVASKEGKEGAGPTASQKG